MDFQYVDVTSFVVCVVLVVVLIKLVRRKLNGYLIGSNQDTQQRSTSSPPPSNKNVKYFTREEVAKHNTAKDCWLIVKEAVYDVSEYVEDHVGGPDSISKFAGQDNTTGFFGPQHPEKVRDMIKDYFIGYLSPSPSSSRPKAD